MASSRGILNIQSLNELTSRMLSTNGSRFWCSHRVVEDDVTADTGVRKNGAPFDAMFLSPFPHRRPLVPCLCRLAATGRRSFAIHTCSISCLMIIIASAALPLVHLMREATRSYQMPSDAIRGLHGDSQGLIRGYKVLRVIRAFGNLQPSTHLRQWR